MRFGAFYARRALRLLPALYVMLALHAIYAAWAGQYATRSGRRSRSAVLYVANWQWGSARSRSYRDLGLLWSLSIEEQFYLVWPAILVALLGAKRNLKAVTIALVAGVVAVVLWRAHLWSVGTWWQRLAVRTDTRVDALLVGALLAVLWVGGMTPRRWVKEAAWIGVAFGVWFVATSDITDDPFGYKGGLTIFAFAIAAIILAVLEGGWAGTRFFDAATAACPRARQLRPLPLALPDLLGGDRPGRGVDQPTAGRRGAEPDCGAIARLLVPRRAACPPAQAALRGESGQAEGQRPGRRSGHRCRADNPAPQAVQPAPEVGARRRGLRARRGSSCRSRCSSTTRRRSTTFQGADGVAFPSGDVERSGFWGLLDLEPTFQDAFDGDGPAIGSAPVPGEEGWEVVSGTWTVDDGRAAVTGW